MADALVALDGDPARWLTMARAARATSDARFGLDRMRRLLTVLGLADAVLVEVAEQRAQALVGQDAGGLLHLALDDGLLLVEQGLEAAALAEVLEALVGKVAVRIQAVHALRAGRLRQAEAELHHLVARRRQRSGQVLRVALGHELGRPLHADAGGPEPRQRVGHGDDLALAAGLQHVVDLQVVVVVTGVGQVGDPDDHHLDGPGVGRGLGAGRRGPDAEDHRD